MKILTGVLAAAAIAWAQPSFGWRATVRPAQKTLPPIEISLGYPDDYIPMQNAPIELRVLGDAPFDGLAGYRFEVGGKATGDVPRATRARHLRGFVRLDHVNSESPPREVIVEWRDRDGRVLASASAGTPPWSFERKPLRISTPSPLPASPRWYEGWREIVVPIDLWFSLRADVRKAIFESGVRLNTIGVPSSAFVRSAVDEAMLPVTFEGGRVTPKKGAVWLSGDAGPRVVRWPRVSWAATEDELRDPPPAMRAVHPRDQEWSLNVPRSAHNVLVGIAQARTVVIFGGAILVSILLWWLSRRGAATTVAVVALVLIAAHPLYRDLIRRREMRMIVETWSRTDGAYWHYREDLAYGAGPLRVAGDWPHPHLRSEPAPSYAEIDGNSRVVRVAYPEPWVLAQQWSSRVELPGNVQVAVETIGAGAITISYDLAIEAEHVFAVWTFDGRYARAATPLHGGRRGRVTLRRDVRERSFALGSEWEHFEFGWLARMGRADIVALSFVARENDTVRVIHWHGDVPATRFVPYEMRAPMRVAEDGRYVAAMVIPEDGLPLRGEATLTAEFLSVNPFRNGLVVEGDGGRLELPPSRAAVCRIRGDDLRRIAREHRLLTFQLPSLPERHLLESANLTLTVRETKP